MRWLLLTLLSLTVPFALLNANGTAAAEDHEVALQSLLTEAGAAQSRGDFASAAGLYRKATELSPSVPELWANLGLMEHELGHSHKAIESFKRAIRLNAGLFVPQLFLGIEYIKSQEPAAAVPHLETARRLNPKDLQTAVSLGTAYAMLGKGDLAANSYWMAINLAPRNGNAWLGLGKAYLQQVESDARIMTSTYGRSPYAKLRAAESLAQEGAFPQAENAYQNALASPHSLSCAHAEFGIVLLDLKKTDQARDQFALETKSGSHCGLERIGLAILDVAQGRPDKGLKELASTANVDPGFVQSNLSEYRNALSADQARQLIALAHTQQNADGHSQRIASLLESALAPDAPAPAADLDDDQESLDLGSIHSTTVEKLYDSQNYYACDQILNSSLSTLSESQQLLLASCSFYAGDYRTTSAVAERLKSNSVTVVSGLYWESKSDERLAIAALTRADEIEPNSAPMHVLIGDAFRQKRHWSEAEGEYRKAVTLDPSSRAARLSLAIVLFTELKTDQAFAVDKALLEEMPGDPEAKLLAAEILVQKHDFQRAEPFLSGCNSLTVELVPRCHVLLGQVYAATGRIPAAISQYRMGLTSDQDGSIHYQLARLYQRIGDKNSAEEEMRLSKQIRGRWDEQAHIDLGQSPTE